MTLPIVFVRSFVSDQSPYEIVRKLGKGKYSDVFEGINQKNKQKCVIKVLKVSADSVVLLMRCLLAVPSRRSIILFPSVLRLRLRQL